jgi:SulP family sulfate permease
VEVRVKDRAAEAAGGMRTAVAVAAPAAALVVVRAVAAAALVVALAAPVLPIAPAAATAAALALTAALLALAAAASTLPFAVLVPDPLLLALMIAALGAVGGDAATVLALVAAAVGLGAAASLMLAWRRSYRLIDLMPLPLAAGLMGGMGLNGVAAGMALAGGRRVDLDALADPTWLLPALTALTAGLFLYVATADRRRPGVAVLVLGLAGLAGYGLAGHGLAGAPAAPGAAWVGLALVEARPGAPDAMTTLPTLVALAVLAALRTRVAVRDLEGETGVDATPRREFALVGLGGMLGLAAAALPVGLSAGLGADVAAAGRHARRVVGALAGLMLVAAALAGWTVRLPATATGAFLVAAGLGLVDAWIVRTARRAGLLERLTLIGVTATVLILGPGYGLLVGTATGAAAFALAYSRAKPVRARFTGAGILSTVDRSVAETAILRDTSMSRVVLTVRGFLFFGTADQLLGAVRDEIRSANGALAHLILDFGEVDGADSSAVDSFRRLLEEAAHARVTVFTAQISDALNDKLMPETDAAARPRRFAAIDEALEAAEQAALAAAAPEAGGRVDGFSVLLANGIGTEVAARILAATTRETLPAGAAIVTQGALSDDLYFLEAGAASVYLELAGGGRVRVRRFGAGTMIGEIGFHLGTPRTATVVADTPSTLLKLSRAALGRLEASDREAAHGFHMLMAQRLCRRILDKDHLIANLMAMSRRG